MTRDSNGDLDVHRDEARAPNIFERHKVKVLILLNIAGLATIDLIAGCFVIPRDHLKALQPHPVYHHALSPNVTAASTYGSLRYKLSTNSLGFRDSSERTVPLESENKRILFIGDSFTEGVGANWEETFVGRVAHGIRPASIEILNGGTSGHCPKLYWLKTRFLIEAVRLEFDEVIVMIDSSDIPEELKYEDYNPRVPSPAGRVLYQLGRILRQRSFLAYSLDQFVRLRGKAGLPSHLQSEEYEDAIHGFWALKQPLCDAYGIPGWKLAEMNMQKLVDLCKANGAKVTIVVFPNANQVQYRDSDSIQVRLWSSFAAKNSLPFLDLFPTFITDPESDLVMIHEKEIQYPYPKYYIPRDVHWNSEGHRIVAEELLKYINPAS